MQWSFGASIGPAPANASISRSATSFSEIIGLARGFGVDARALVSAVEQAKQRRKGQRLTQQRLAALAGVGTPTVSRLESGRKDIQLSTVTRTLAVLGMIDERVLSFPKSDARYDSLRQVVLFAGNAGARTTTCAISLEALEDHFDRDNRVPMKAFRANRGRIGHEARRKYPAGRLESDGSVLIKAADL